MILSPFIRFIEKENRYFLYNLYTKSILEVDNEVFFSLQSSSFVDTTHLTAQSDEDKNLLFEKGIIVESKEAINQSCRDWIIWNRLREDFLHLTILPTLDCCCSCYYCFEKNRHAVYMNNQVIDSIVKLILGKKELQRLHITWFGGEPLMAKDIIRSIYAKLSKSFNGLYSSDIITNGIHLDEKAIQLFQECNISEVQISLDGLKETHNKIKKCESVEDVYEETLNNVARLVEADPKICVNLRVNFSKNHIKDFVESHKYISERFKNSPVNISPGFLVNKNSTSCVEGLSCTYFNLYDKYKCTLMLWEKFGIPTGRILSNDYTLECAIRNKESLVIGPNGEIYKCWEHVGSESKQIGHIMQNGIVEYSSAARSVDELLSLTDPLQISICKECEYLPLCYGGCPLERSNNINLSNCILNSAIYNKLIEAHIEYLIQCGRI